MSRLTLREAVEQITTLREALEKMVHAKPGCWRCFDGEDDTSCCPYCGHAVETDHAPDCALMAGAAALEAIRGN